MKKTRIFLPVLLSSIFQLTAFASGVSCPTHLLDDMSRFPRHDAGNFYFSTSVGGRQAQWSAPSGIDAHWNIWLKPGIQQPVIGINDGIHSVECIYHYRTPQDRPDEVPRTFPIKLLNVGDFYNLRQVTLSCPSEFSVNTNNQIHFSQDGISFVSTSGSPECLEPAGRGRNPSRCSRAMSCRLGGDASAFLKMKSFSTTQDQILMQCYYSILSCEPGGGFYNNHIVFAASRPEEVPANSHVESPSENKVVIPTGITSK